MYLVEVKKPAESKGPYDYFKVLDTIPADQAFRPLAEEKGVCGLVKSASRSEILGCGTHSNTIGHGTRPLDEFVGLLQSVGVTLLVDLRTVPRSRTRIRNTIGIYSRILCGRTG